MPSNYPSGTDALTNPASSDPTNNPSHSAQHIAENDAIEAIQSATGTHSGTNVLMNFVAGQFPVRNTGGGATGTLVQTLVSGTVNNTVLGTPTVTLGGDTTGDIFFRSAGGTVNRLAAGTLNHVLTSGGVGTPPSWAASSAGSLTSQIITSTRDLTAASGTVGYTGVGFQPTVIYAQCGIDAGTVVSLGIVDSALTSNGKALANVLGVWTLKNGLIYAETTSGNSQSFAITSFTADGFAGSWTKVGTPTSTITLVFLCLK